MSAVQKYYGIQYQRQCPEQIVAQEDNTEGLIHIVIPE